MSTDMETPTVSKKRAPETEAGAEAKKTKVTTKEQRKKEAEEKREKKRKETEEKKLKRERDAEERRLKKEKDAEERRLKKEAREKEAEEKRQKKLKDAEERRVKKEKEAEEKRLKKEAKQREKEEKEKEKEEEKKKEEERKSRHAITNFFHVKKKTEEVKEEVKVEEEIKSEYESTFLPFFVNSNTVLITHAPSTSSFVDVEELLKGEINVEEEGVRYAGPEKKPRCLASDVAQQMNLGLIRESQEKFALVPQRFLQFYENSKPAYCGTFSYSVADVNEPIRENPFVKVTKKGESLLNIDYEYDSDLEEEGEEEGDGEDIEKESEDEDEEDEEDTTLSDIDEFIERDSSQGSTSSKRKILGPLKPETRWIGQTIDAESDAFGKYFTRVLGFQVLSEPVNLPIDPFKDYWKVEKPKCEVVEVRKKVITDSGDIERMKQFIVANKEYTLNTLTEIMQKQVLSAYSRMMVKNSIREVAEFDKVRNEWIMKP